MYYEGAFPNFRPRFPFLSFEFPMTRLQRARAFPAFLVAIGCCLLAGAELSQAAEFVTSTEDDGVTVKVDGQLFLRYLKKSGPKPVVWPLIGPTGKEMTRAWPLRPESRSEAQDHVHQRSLWFTFGRVNGVSFWHETPGHGVIEHREFKRVAGGPSAVIETGNDWLGPDGKKILSDVRSIACGANDVARWLDFDIILTSGDTPVVFADDKEGMFGVRVAHSMAVDSKQGGEIVSSEGKKNGAAWGQPAAWVDYHGPVNGESVGIAILNHPSSFRFPTHWHVRTYGLFAANPFGKKAFSGGAEKGVDGTFQLKPKENLVFRYRVLLHRGDEKEGRVAEAFAEYEKEKK